MLMGKFSIEEEEQVVANAIEQGMSAEEFSDILDGGEGEIDFFKQLMSMPDDETVPPKTVDDETLYTDIDYLYSALRYLNATGEYPVEKLGTVSGLDITVMPDMYKRLYALVPKEALPENGHLRLSDDKAFCMAEMKRSMQNNMAETAWPKVQYLWKLHPIFNWINDKGSLLYKRNEAPFIEVPGKMQPGETIFIVTGSIPNLKSTPLVDEWFGLSYVNGKFSQVYTMEELIQKTGLANRNLPNARAATQEEIQTASNLLQDAVEQAKAYLGIRYEEYQQRMNPQIDEEITKLAKLEDKHKGVIQLSLFESERKRSEKERQVDELFDKFTNWVRESLTIQDNPYIRIIAAIKGV